MQLFNYTWMLLEKADRTDRESDLMVDAAHASRLFWEEAGAPANHARSDWQVSHVYATVGSGEQAVSYAEKCLAICQAHAIGDWDLAYAFEALARGYAVAGDWEAAARYEMACREAAQQIAGAEDQKQLLDDLTTLPRPGG